MATTNGLVKGLKSIQGHFKEQEERRAAAKDFGPKTVWFGLKANQSVKVRFLQELDEDSPHYDENLGLGVFAVEHSNPDNFKLKALCTIDSGQCYGCEQHRANKGKEGYTGGWSQRAKMYINVLVDDGENAPYVAVLSQSNGAKSVTPSVIAMAEDSGSITNNLMKITRRGSGLSDTYYTPFWTARAEEQTVAEVLGDKEVFDLEKILRLLPYSEQESYYNPDSVAQRPNLELVGSATSSRADVTEDAW